MIEAGFNSSLSDSERILVQFLEKPHFLRGTDGGVGVKNE